MNMGFDIAMTFNVDPFVILAYPPSELASLHEWAGRFLKERKG
jgi:hypothetical protein